MASFEDSITAVISNMKTLYLNRTCTETQAIASASTKPNTIFYTTDTHKIVVGGVAYGWGKAEGIPYATTGSTSTATAFVATVPGITALTDGTCVILKNTKVASAAASSDPACFTLDVNGLGAKRVYTTNASATYATTQFAKNYTLMFIYDSSLNSSAGGWRECQLFNTNTTYSAMSQTEADTGTATSSRTITAKVLRDTIDAHIPTATTARIGGALVAEVNSNAVSELSSTGLSYTEVLWRIDSGNKGYTKVPVITSNEDSVGSTKNVVAYSAGYSDSLFARKANINNSLVWGSESTPLLGVNLKDTSLAISSTSGSEGLYVNLASNSGLEVSNGLKASSATTSSAGIVTLTSSVTQNDTTHVPTADAVYGAISSIDGIGSTDIDDVIESVFGF